MAEVPVRIQRKRTRGWRAPEGTIMCTRPGPWGNPFVVSRVGRSFEVHDHFQLTDDPIPEFLLMDVCSTRELANQSALRLFRGYLRKPAARARFRAGLMGAKFLACWCPLETRDCHVEIILEVLRDG